MVVGSFAVPYTGLSASSLFLFWRKKMTYKDISNKRLLERFEVLQANVVKRKAECDRLKDARSKELLAEDKRALEVCEKEIQRRKKKE